MEKTIISSDSEGDEPPPSVNSNRDITSFNVLAYEFRWYQSGKHLSSKPVNTSGSCSNCNYFEGRSLESEESDILCGKYRSSVIPKKDCGDWKRKR